MAGERHRPRPVASLTVTVRLEKNRRTRPVIELYVVSARHTVTVARLGFGCGKV